MKEYIFSLKHKLMKLYYYTDIFSQPQKLAFLNPSYVIPQTKSFPEIMTMPRMKYVFLWDKRLLCKWKPISRIPFAGYKWQ